MSTSVPLGLGLSSVCSVTWDDDAKEYHEADTTERIKCCLSQCDKPYESCMERCGSGTKCRATCIEQKASCVQTCEIMSPLWTTDSPYKQCLSEINCGDLDQKSCIDSHREFLQKCCRQWCVPTHETDCDSYCAFSETLLRGGSNVPLEKSSISSATVYKTYSDDTAKYTFVATGIAISCVVAWYLYTRK